jgi:hypothetical protein
MSDKIQKNYYSIIPADVRYDKRLKPLARLLYGEITALCNEKGYCWASNSYFAELYEVSDITISRYISELKEYGYIKCVYDKTQENIDKRKIYIIPSYQNGQDGLNRNDNTVLTKQSIPSYQNNQDGINRIVKYNNTNNNTNNNTESVCETHAHENKNEVDILLNSTEFQSFEDFERAYVFWFTKLTGKPITLLNQTVSARGENFEKLDWLKKNFEARRVHAGIAIFETLEYIAQDKTCIDNYRFRASSYLDGIISRLVDAELAESDPVSNEGKGKYRNPSFDYFKY